jgi:hypothetical protein
MKSAMLKSAKNKVKKLKDNKLKKKLKPAASTKPSARRTINVFEGDFILIQDNSVKKPVLAKVISVKDSKIHGILSYERIALDGEDSFKFECDPLDVVANLGPKPAFGKVFGCDIEPYHKTFRHQLSDAQVAVMVDLSDKEEEKLVDAMSKIYKIAKKHGFLKHFKQIRYVIRPGISSVAGMWSLAKDGSEKIDLYVPRSDASDKKAMPFDYVIAHEAGHHIWNRYFEETEKAVWIALHRKALAVEEANTAKIAHLRAGLVAAGSIKEFRKSLETDEEKKLFSEILSKVCKTFKVRPDELNALLKSGDNLSQFWLTTAVQRSDSSIIITEYARKNSQELFAECLAHFLTGAEMPEKLAKKTANYLRKAVNRGPHGDMRPVKISG